jgi:hypothetical protein
MKITGSQLRSLIREQVEEEIEQTQPTHSPELQGMIDQLEDLSLDDITALWKALSGVHKRKENELKAGFKKGDRVEFDHEGVLKTGEVVRRGGKFVMVDVDGWEGKPWKRWASSLRRV